MSPAAPRTPTPASGLLLCYISGFPVYLHWSWFVVAVFELSGRGNAYSSPLWNVLEYLSLFGMVLLHELGHAFACRQVGGSVDKVVLWPLGGLAYVSPPPRPWAELWCLAAGPLVNLLLVPVSFAVLMVGVWARWATLAPDVWLLLQALAVINVGLLVFNLLPIYPLDGGRILRAVIWFFLGQRLSLAVASFLGLIGGVLLLAAAIWWGDGWMIAVSLYLVLQAGACFFRLDLRSITSEFGESGRHRTKPDLPSDGVDQSQPGGPAAPPRHSVPGEAAWARAVEELQAGNYEKAVAHG